LYEFDPVLYEESDAPWGVVQLSLNSGVKM